MNNYRARWIVNVLGRRGPRIFYRILCFGLIVVGLILLITTEAPAQRPCYSALGERHKPGERITCTTDKKTYSQGENVLITVTNISDGEVFIINRKYIDAGVATIERKDAKGDWQAIELFAAATVSITKILKPCDSHIYVWKTVGYNRSDTVADPGTYRILFPYDTYTNQFQIQE